MRASEWVLLAACFGLLLVGPAMAYQEFAQLDEAARALEQERSRAELTQTAPRELDTDVGYREAWRWPLFALVVVAGVLGSLVAVRVARARRWRAVSGRLLGLLLGGLTIMDVAYLVDVQWAFAAPHLVRGWIVLFVYPAGAVLVAGALYRLRELEPLFGSDAPPVPVLSPSIVARAGERSSEDVE